MKRSPIVNRDENRTASVTYANTRPTRDGKGEGEVWASNEGVYIWQGGHWVKTERNS